MEGDAYVTTLPEWARYRRYVMVRNAVFRPLFVIIVLLVIIMLFIFPLAEPLLGLCLLSIAYVLGMYRSTSMKHAVVCVRAGKCPECGSSPEGLKILAHKSGCAVERWIRRHTYP